MTEQEKMRFQLPADSILALADYTPTPSVTMDSKKEYMLLSYRNAYKSLEDLNQEEICLGGLRINPTTNIASGINYFNNLQLKKVKES